MEHDNDLEDDVDHEAEVDEPEDDNECPHCWGTGEGQYDGSSCGSCRGKGYLQRRNQEDP